jgi:hypothetical protein
VLLMLAVGVAAAAGGSMAPVAMGVGMGADWFRVADEQLIVAAMAAAGCDTCGGGGGGGMMPLSVAALDWCCIRLVVSGQ